MHIATHIKSLFNKMFMKAEGSYFGLLKTSYLDIIMWNFKINLAFENI